MGSTGAARRQQEREQEPPPDPVAASVAGIGRVIAASDATRRKVGRHERAIAAELGRMRQVAAECPDAERLAVAADKLAARVNLLVVELISDAAHNAEAREALERCTEAIEVRAASATFTEAMRADAFEAGRQAGIAEEQARASRAPRGRHAARKRHLKVAGSIAAGSAVAASLVAGSAVIASQDSAAIGHWSPRPVSVRLHAEPADSAVLMPSSSPRAYVPRHAKPNADAASATQAPSSVPSSPAPQPPPPSPSPVASHTDFDGRLDVQTARCVIGLDGSCKFTFMAIGGSVSWSASPPAGLSLSRSGGTLADGQPEVITVTAQAGLPAGAGVITLTDGGGHSVDVPVTWVAVPGLPL